VTTTRKELKSLGYSKRKAEAKRAAQREGLGLSRQISKVKPNRPGKLMPKGTQYQPSMLYQSQQEQGQLAISNHKNRKAKRQPAKVRSWADERERETVDMVVVRKRDGLAMKPPVMGGGGPTKRHVASHGLRSGVSKHCEYVPTAADLGFLSLDATKPLPRPPAAGPGGSLAEICAGNPEALRFVEWYREKEGKDPAVELVTKVMGRMK